MTTGSVFYEQAVMTCLDGMGLTRVHLASSMGEALDSISAAEFFASLEDALDVELPLSLMSECTTFGDIAAALAGTGSASASGRLGSNGSGS